MPPAATRELPKSIGRYEIVRQIGVGAMGRVLLGRDPVLERHVAVKVLRDDLAIPSEVRDGLLVRMRHEARAAARVTHPHLVVLHDMGEDPDLGLYLVFEYLEGPTLKERLRERRLSARQAGRLARELGGALTFAHEKGVLHRDVKPENIILTPVGAKLADFGIARVPDSTLTHAGGLLGTPAYSAPETFRDGKFSPASDQFSLASTLYEALSGERAFPGDDAVSVASRITNDIQLPFAERRGYAKELDEVLLRGLAKLPSDRFDSCSALGEALVRALAEKPSESSERSSGRISDTSVSTARASFAPPTQGAREERRPWRVLLGGTVVVAVLALLVRSYLKNQDAALEAAVPSSSVEPESNPPTPSAAPSAPRHSHGTGGKSHDDARPTGGEARPEASDEARLSPSADSVPPAPSVSAAGAPAGSATPNAHPPASASATPGK